jgi:hypothetical protein
MATVTKHLRARLVDVAIDRKLDAAKKRWGLKSSPSQPWLPQAKI